MLWLGGMFSSVKTLAHDFRNGTGKSSRRRAVDFVKSNDSALFQAIADKLIPGLAPSLRILLVSQVQDAERVEDTLGTTTVLDHVVTGDKQRTRAMEEFQGDDLACYVLTVQL